MEKFDLPSQSPEQKNVTKFEANKLEILQVHKVLQKVDEFISQAVDESRGHYEDYDSFMKSKFVELGRLLSEEDCFEFKFSTSSAFKDGEEIVPEYSLENDSLYFVTKSGISMRLKAKNLKYGIQEVLQPVSEKVFFKRGEKVTYEPVAGDEVYEAKSSSFGKAILSGKVDNYYPELEMEGEDVSSLRRFHFHSGHRINFIFK
jgi:hypothetical protein